MAAPETSRLSASDRVEILDLYGQYALTLDSGDGSGWADCFASTGTFAVMDEDGSTVLHVAGGDALDRYARQHRSGPRAAMRHHFTNVALKWGPVGAEGRAAILYVRGATPLGSGFYDDELVQVTDRWLFSRRVVVHEPFPA